MDVKSSSRFTMRRCISFWWGRAPAVRAGGIWSWVLVVVHSTVAVTLRRKWPGGPVVIKGFHRVFVVAVSRHDVI